MNELGRRLTHDFAQHHGSDATPWIPQACNLRLLDGGTYHFIELFLNENLQICYQLW